MATRHRHRGVDISIPHHTTNRSSLDRLPRELRRRVCDLADGKTLKTIRQLNHEYSSLATRYLFESISIGAIKVANSSPCGGFSYVPLPKRKGKLNMSVRKHVKHLFYSTRWTPTCILAYDARNPEFDLRDKIIEATSHFLRGHRWPGLVSLDLQGIIAPPHELVAFMIAHAATLRQLRMSQIELCPINSEWHSPRTNTVTSFASLFGWMHRKLRLGHVHLAGKFRVVHGESWWATDQLMLGIRKQRDGNGETSYRERVENYIAHKGPSPFRDSRYIAGETVDDSWERVLPGIGW